MADGPNRFNWVTLLILLSLGAGVYGAWKFLPVARPHATASWFPATPAAAFAIAQRTHSSGWALYPARSPR